jgi:S1-C subfamily serine protease
MKRYYLLLQLLALASLSVLTSCATILGGRHQDVKVRAKGDDVRVYLDGQLKDTGHQAQLTVSRRPKPHELTVKAEGYKPEQKLLFQNKGSWLRALSIFPFGVTIYTPFIDFYIPGPRALDFKDVYNIRNEQLPFPERGANRKFVHLQALNLNLKEENLRFGYSFKYEDFKVNTPETYDLADMRYDARRASRIEPAAKQLSKEYRGDTLERILRQHHYYDTTGMLPDRVNTTFLKADVEQLTFHTASHTWPVATNPLFTRGSATVNMTLENYYGQKLAKEEVYVETGGFEMSRYKNEMEKLVGLIVKDVLYGSVARFMNNNTVKKHLQRDDTTMPDYETLTLKRGEAITTLGEAKRATVTIQAGDEDHGSGCVVGRNGYILTNYQVVASGSADNNLRVLAGRSQPLKAELIRKNANLDLALIKVNQTFDKTFRIPSETELEGGKTAYAIGTPASVELGQSLTKGIISGVRALEGIPYIQSDVSVNPGSFGGALVNDQGQLLGLVSGKLIGIGTEGVSFSLSADILADKLSLAYPDSPK